MPCVGDLVRHDSSRNFRLAVRHHRGGHKQNVRPGFVEKRPPSHRVEDGWRHQMQMQSSCGLRFRHVAEIPRL